MSLLRRQRATAVPRPTIAVPPPSRGWVETAYGKRADDLVNALPGLMGAATAEAVMPSTSPYADGALRSQTQRGLLWDDLKDLRSVIIEIDVHEDDTDRDRRLRAAVATAIGAAGSLALASSSQPTAGYLRLTQSAVNGVLDAAGRRTLG